MQQPLSERLHLPLLDLRPLPAAAAAALPDVREPAERLLGAHLSPEWPQPELLDVLPRQARAAPEEERFGIWVMIERATATVVGDIGFFGPPGTDGLVEVGYGVVPTARRRGHASSALGALTTWALEQPTVTAVAARCDPDNVASIRTLERAAFTRTGADDEHLFWIHR